jgi:hypothetical protein
MTTDCNSSIEQLLLAEKVQAKTVSLITRLIPKRYSAAELNALCSLKTPIPVDLLSWEAMADIGDEVLTTHNML